MTRNTTLRDRYRRSIAKDHPPCHLCGEEIDYQASHLDPLAFTIDHIIPLNGGGSDTLENIAAAHRKCNRDKSDTIPLEAGVVYVTERAW
jgi:5-methylcytosine-specific restriction endonuclease McrA